MSGYDFMRLSKSLLLLAVLPLAACGTDAKDLPPCPRVSVLADAAKMTRFKPGDGRDLTDVVLRAEFLSYRGSCTYDAEKKVAKLSLQVGIGIERGPAAAGRQQTLSYFVAIPAFYPDPKGRSEMPVVIDFPEKSDRVRYTDEEIEVAIPVANLKDLPKYEVFLGLQLDHAALEYNRRHGDTR